MTGREAVTQPAGRCCRACSDTEWELRTKFLGRSNLGDAQHMLPIGASSSSSLGKIPPADFSGEPPWAGSGGLMGPWVFRKAWAQQVVFGVQTELLLLQVRVGPDHTSTPVARRLPLLDDHAGAHLRDHLPKLGTRRVPAAGGPHQLPRGGAAAPPAAVPAPLPGHAEVRQLLPKEDLPKRQHGEPALQPLPHHRGRRVRDDAGVRHSARAAKENSQQQQAVEKIQTERAHPSQSQSRAGLLLLEQRLLQRV